MALSFSSIAKTTVAVGVGAAAISAIKPLTRTAQSTAPKTALDLGAVDTNFNTSNVVNNFNAAISEMDERAGVANISPQISGISGFSQSNFNDLLKGVGDTVTGVIGGIGEGIGNIVEGGSKLIGKGINAVAEFIDDLNLSQLEEFTNNIINVVPKGQAELIGAVGGEFEKLRQQVEAIGENVSNLDDFVNLTFKAPWDADAVRGQNVTAVQNAGRSKSKIPNPLRDHNSFNYIITLGILEPDQFNFPESYRTDGGFKNYIIKSGGGDYGIRYQVYDEENVDFESFGTDISRDNGDHAEYFIDDIEIDAVIAPNPNTGVALGTTIRFNVTEPFSMGNFIEAVIGSARDAGYDNYVNAPFCLKFDFVGWNEDGQTNANFIGRPIYIPIKITQMGFNVTGKGSEYAVEAISFSEVALGDEANECKTTVNAVGATVWEVLNGQERSVSSALNQRIENLEKNGATPQGDRYVIAFPKDLNGMKKAIQGVAPPVIESLTGSEQTRREKGLAKKPETPASKDQAVNTVIVKPKSQLFQILDAYSKDTNKMNAIGLSLLVEDTAEGGDQKMSDPNSTYSEDGSDVAKRNAAETAPAEKAREHKFSQGERITQIIEKVILRSRYAAEHATKESNKNGTKQWFKIDTQVYIDPDKAAEAAKGRPSLIYVYSVIPYFPDEAKFLGTKERPQNTEGLKASAAKEYNYIYTGLNEDVLEFNLNFNNAFMQTAFANLGQNPGGTGLADKAYASKGDSNCGTKLNDNANSTQTNEAGAGVKEVTKTSVPSSGTRSSDVKLRIAETFHDRITNQIVDMVTCEMTILGDPFYLPQQTGNYVGQPVGGSPNLTEDGTMNYMQNEVFVVINFKTPFDYQISGATMEFPQTVPQFSGLFNVWAVTNTFKSGKFEQVLKLIRRRGQDDPPTTGNVGPVKVDDKACITDQVLLDVANKYNVDPKSEQARMLAEQEADFFNDEAEDPCSKAPTVPPASVTVGGVSVSTQTPTVFPGKPIGVTAAGDAVQYDEFGNPYGTGVAP